MGGGESARAYRPRPKPGWNLGKPARRLRGRLPPVDDRRLVAQQRRCAMRTRHINSAKHIATKLPARCVPRAILAGFAATLAMLLAFLMAYNLARVASAAMPADASSTGLARLW